MQALRYEPQLGGEDVSVSTDDVSTRLSPLADFLIARAVHRCACVCVCLLCVCVCVCVRVSMCACVLSVEFACSISSCDPRTVSLPSESGSVWLHFFATFLLWMVTIVLGCVCAAVIACVNDVTPTALRSPTT